MDPSPAELARTAVALARVGTLTTYGRRAPLQPRTTTVAVTGEGACLVVRVRPDSPAAADLLARPLATVQVGPPGAPPVLVQGGASRLPGRDEQGRLAFRVEPGAVRVGARPSPVPVPVEDYLGAEPDPLRHEAPALLEHLRRGHAAALAACVRARGLHAARWVEPRALDRHGLLLTALCDDGVATVRLDFPAPVGSLAELAPGLRALLQCRGACGCGEA